MPGCVRRAGARTGCSGLGHDRPTLDANHHPGRPEHAACHAKGIQHVLNAAKCMAGGSFTGVRRFVLLTSGSSLSLRE
jgi:hypothetical protein